MFKINSSINYFILGALRKSQADFTTSVQRLSTGFRVNSFGDDPGVASTISEMRNEIAATDQLMTSTQESINYTKTADAGLAEISRLLEDANAIATAASNDATLSADQRTNYQTQLSAIMTAINNIANNTTYGDVKMLNGSAGSFVGGTAVNTIDDMTFSGMFGGYALTTNATVSVALITAATLACVSTKSFATPVTTVGAGSFSINGMVFNTSATDTISDVVSKINQNSNTTGVTAVGTSGVISLAATTFGSNASVEVIDAGSLLLDSSATYSSVSGVDAVATVAILVGSDTAVVSFDQGYGRELKDLNGNVIKLTSAGAVITAATERGLGQVIKSTSLFAVDKGVTTGFYLGNYSANQLGSGVIANTDLEDISVSSATSASSAVSVINQAQSDIAFARASVGSFQKYVLESNYRMLQVRNENAEASRANLQDTDFAAESTSMTKALLVQSSAATALSQTSLIPQSILSLIKS